MLALALACLLASSPTAPKGRVSISRSASSTLCDGGVCVTANPVLLCDALAAGDKAANWWCLNGDGSTATGSVFADGTTPLEFWSVLRDAGVGLGAGIFQTSLRPIFPNGALQTMTHLNNYPLTNQHCEYFTSHIDGGGDARPVGSFTVCAFGATHALIPGAISTATDWVSLGSSTAATFALESVHSSGVFMEGTGGIGSNNNNVVTPIRSFALHCGIFTSAYESNMCTFHQGTERADCVRQNQTVANMTAGSVQPWSVGRQYNLNLATACVGSTEFLDGLFAGAFYTNKALSPGDITRIGNAILPSPSKLHASAEVLRWSSRMCCDSLNRCVMLPPNVPCVNGTTYSRDTASGVNGVSASHVELLSGWTAVGACPGGSGTCFDGGTNKPFLFSDTVDSPWGTKTADNVLFMATSGSGTTASMSGFDVSAGSSSSVSEPITCSIYAHDTDGDQVPVHMCLIKTGSERYCTFCNPSATNWTRCEWTVSSLAASYTSTFSIGSLCRYDGGQGGCSFPGTQMAFTGYQCERVTSATSFMYPGELEPPFVSRYPESCLGACCP